MIRRRFLQLVAFSSAASLAPFEAIASTAATTIVFRVKGFSCITCAVGLDTMMQRKHGIISSESTYPEGKVTVCFDPARITASAVRAVITDAGFTVEDEHNVQAKDK